jgi:hypothetical protein
LVFCCCPKTMEQLIKLIKKRMYGFKLKSIYRFLPRPVIGINLLLILRIVIWNWN